MAETKARRAKTPIHYQCICHECGYRARVIYGSGFYKVQAHSGGGRRYETLMLSSLVAKARRQADAIFNGHHCKTEG